MASKKRLILHSFWSSLVGPVTHFCFKAGHYHSAYSQLVQNEAVSCNFDDSYLIPKSFKIKLHHLLQHLRSRKVPLFCYIMYQVQFTELSSVA